MYRTMQFCMPRILPISWSLRVLSRGILIDRVRGGGERILLLRFSQDKFLLASFGLALPILVSVSLCVMHCKMPFCRSFVRLAIQGGVCGAEVSCAR